MMGIMGIHPNAVRLFSRLGIIGANVRHAAEDVHYLTMIIFAAICIILWHANAFATKAIMMIAFA